MDITAPVVVLSKGLADMFRQFGPIPERHGREKMVRNVVVRDLQEYQSEASGYLCSTRERCDTNVVEEEAAHPA